MKTIFLTLFALVLVFGLSVDASAQKKRKKQKAPLPMPTPVQVVEPTIVSRASDEADLEDYFPRNNAGDPASGIKTPTSDGQILLTTDNQVTNTNGTVSTPVSSELADQVRALSTKINSIDDRQKMLLDLQILSSAEQRAEGLRKQLLDLSDKEATIRPRLEQIEYDIRPEVIERNAAFIGSLRPEEVRASMKRKLETERERLNAQLVQMQSSRTSIEVSLQSADGLVTKLRTKLEQEIEVQLLAPPKPEAKKPE